MSDISNARNALLDRKDAEWATQVDIELLPKAAEDKQAECLDNAAECGHFADDVMRTIFW